MKERLITGRMTQIEVGRVIMMAGRSEEIFHRFFGGGSLNEELMRRRAERQAESFGVVLFGERGEVRGFSLASGIGTMTGMGSLEALAVHESVRRQGYGRLLVGDTLRALKDGGAASVSAWVKKDNLGGVSFLQNYGFEIVEDEIYGPELFRAQIRVPEDI